MSMTLTLRADEELRDALEGRARAEGKTVSEVVREILRDALEPRPLGSRTRHLSGRLRLGPNPADKWRRSLRRRNWRR